MNIKLGTHQKGLAVLDILTALGIIIVLVSVIFAIGGFASSQTNLVKVSIWHAQLIESIQNAYKPQNNCAGISATRVAQLNAAPSDMIQGTDVVDGWGSSMTIAAATTTVTNDTFVATYPKVAAEDCSVFATSIQEKHFKISVAGNVVKDLSAGTTFNVGTLAQACAGSATKAIAASTRCR